MISSGEPDDDEQSPTELYRMSGNKVNEQSDEGKSGRNQQYFEESNLNQEFLTAMNEYRGKRRRDESVYSANSRRNRSVSSHANIELVR